jgi:hypothetical protein
MALLGRFFQRIEPRKLLKKKDGLQLVRVFDGVIVSRSFIVQASCRRVPSPELPGEEGAAAEVEAMPLKALATERKIPDPVLLDQPIVSSA